MLLDRRTHQTRSQVLANKTHHVGRPRLKEGRTRESPIKVSSCKEGPKQRIRTFVEATLCTTDHQRALSSEQQPPRSNTAGEWRITQSCLFVRMQKRRSAINLVLTPTLYLRSHLRRTTPTTILLPLLLQTLRLNQLSRFNQSNIRIRRYVSAMRLNLCIMYSVRKEETFVAKTYFCNASYIYTL